VSLLRPPGDEVRLGGIYRIDRRLYDETDSVEHPVLVVSKDPMFQIARVATRTTNERSRTRLWVPHGPSPALGLNLFGYFRLADMHSVSFGAFDSDSIYCGDLDEHTFARIVRTVQTGQMQ
jgi:hypothetical protein